MELSNLGTYADEGFILRTEQVRLKNGNSLAIKRGRKWITTGYPNHKYEKQANTWKPPFTLEEWTAILRKPENKAFNQLNLTEGFYKADIYTYKERRRARRRMRNLRKQLAKFNNDNGE